MNKPVAKLEPEAEVAAPVDPLALLRQPFPENLISQLPKETGKQRDERLADQKAGKWPPKCTVCDGYHHPRAVHLNYVGHAAATDRLLDADPRWNWEPMGLTPEGLPAFDKNGGLWIKLTVDGVTRIGYGSADGKTGGDAIKEIIGDALRNSGMRFGMALDLWHKGDLHAHHEEPTPTAEELAINLLRGSTSKPHFKEAWEKNKDGWKKVMEPDAYARVVAVMKEIAGAFPKDEPAPPPAPPPPPPPSAAVLEIADDEIPW